MPNYRRYYIPNAFIFITQVTCNRAKILDDPRNLALFWDTLKAVQRIHPFHLVAFAIMPDHFHWIMQVPEDRPNFSIPMHSIKRNYSINFRKSRGIDSSVQLWQPRYWDHVIRDEDDMQRHFDYIHWNPVKHGYAADPDDWGASSFRFWVQQGCYPPHWGDDGEPAIIRDLITNDL